MKNQLFIGIHIAVWVLGYVIINLPQLNLTVGYFHSGDQTLLIPSLYGTLFNAIIFYGNWKKLIPEFPLSTFRYFVYLLGLIFLITVTESWLDKHLAELYFPENQYGFWEDYFTDNLFFHLLFFLAPSYGFYFFERWQNGEKLQQKLREEKLKAELSLLRSQINPHFLFNTLNNLFASAYQYGDTKTADGISILSDLMRYMLYESNAEKVSLEKEIQYLEDYLSLQKMRFSDQDSIQIELNISVDRASDILLPPMLFIPFIENAFKHGISLQEPSEIIIDFKRSKGDALIFNCKNSISPKRKKQDPLKNSGGFGLENVRERLNLLFPGKHKIDIQQTETEFLVQLELEIS